MKRCPQCNREYDPSMMFCLDDGAELLYGPASAEEQATALVHSTSDPSEAPTRAQIHTTNQTEILPSGKSNDRAESRPLDRRVLVVPLILAVILAGGFFGYRYFNPTDSKQIASIAVLPFQNVGGDPNVEYVSDGLAEALINSLTDTDILKRIG